MVSLAFGKDSLWSLQTEETLIIIASAILREYGSVEGFRKLWNWDDTHLFLTKIVRGHKYRNCTWY